MGKPSLYRHTPNCEELRGVAEDVHGDNGGHDLQHPACFWGNQCDGVWGHFISEPDYSEVVADDEG